MEPLTARIISMASAGLLIFEAIKGDYLIHLDSSNSAVDSIIIIVAMAGLLWGIFIPEAQTSDSASLDAETDLAATTTDPNDSSEGD